MEKDIKKIVFVVILAICLVLLGIFFYIRNAYKSDNIVSKNIEISIYDKDNNSIYNESETTSEKYLIEVLKKIDDITIETEDSNYGEFITSINGLEQGDNYYWNYYVNDEYATVGASSYEVQDNDKIMFKLEKFE